MTGNVAENGRAVVITGGGTGIGQAAAWAFADRGAKVLVVGRTAATLEETCARHPSIHALVADISAADAAETIVRTALERFGRIDVLVNNAAFIRESTLEQLDRADTEAQVAINLLAPMYLTHQALGPLTETRGTVVTRIPNCCNSMSMPRDMASRACLVAQ